MWGVVYEGVFQGPVPHKQYPPEVPQTKRKKHIQKRESSLGKQLTGSAVQRGALKEGAVSNSV